MTGRWCKRSTVWRTISGPGPTSFPSIHGAAAPSRRRCWRTSPASPRRSSNCARNASPAGESIERSGGQIGEAPLVAAISVHYEDLTVTPDLADEDDLTPVG